VNWQEAKIACESMNMTLMDKTEDEEETAKISDALLRKDAQLEMEVD